MTRLVVRPIDTWPAQETARPQSSQFSAPWFATVELLDRELTKLGARHGVIQIAVDEHEIRRDGTMPLATARLRHPGVIVAFDSEYGPLKYVADRFDRWQDNVRAIALGLEALRKVDRYGITKRGEQYTGWRALPPGRPMGPAMTMEEAAQFLLDTAWRDPASAGIDPDAAVRQVIEDPDTRRRVYRDAAKTAHPDNGGDPEVFVKVREAYDLLRAAA